jgi:hypothetical protein
MTRHVSDLLRDTASILLALVLFYGLLYPSKMVEAQSNIGSNYVEITGKGNNVIKSAPGQLNNIVVTNAGTAWTFIIYDNTTCTGSAIIVGGGGAITVPTAPFVYQFNLQTNTGLCITTGGTTAGSMTVGYR